jgi:glycosyltransferase involved in cell wall biosynthesis
MVQGVECYHVNVRLSRNLEDIGDFRIQKIFHLIRCCLSAIYLRFRHGVTNFYYVPAPGKSLALVRDWIVFSLCRPFFKRFVFHWHAAGLAIWLNRRLRFPTQSITRRLMKNVDLSIVLSQFSHIDPETLLPKRIELVRNGIPDPCPDFEKAVLPRRQARLAMRRRLLSGQSPSNGESSDVNGSHLFKVLFLAHCSREKGLFDTLDGVALANERLDRARSPIRVHLTVAGEFTRPRERAEFERRVRQPDLQLTDAEDGSRQTATLPAVHYAGFVGGEMKHRLFAESDCFCLPTYYRAESFGLVLVEAMAFGLPIIAARWRSIPEILPEDYPGIVPVRSPEMIADAILHWLNAASLEPLRSHFLRNFTVDRHLSRLAEAIRGIETGP